MAHSAQYCLVHFKVYENMDDSNCDRLPPLMEKWGEYEPYYLELQRSDPEDVGDDVMRHFKVLNKTLAELNFLRNPTH